MAKKSKIYSVTSPKPKTRRPVKSADASQPEFDTVESIRKVKNNMQAIENERARDRALIDTLANGERPYSAQEVAEYQVQWNINWGDMNKTLRDANGQVNGALLFKPTLFTATSKGGQLDKRDEYSQKFTTKINDQLILDEQGSKFRYLIKSRNASVVLHGPGIMYWPNSYCPLPSFCPLENFLVPTDTLLDFSNCSYFNIKTELTPFELFERTHGEVVDKNWNMEQVDAILEGLEEIGTLNTENYDWVTHPEKMQELFKQNRCYLNSDAVAKVKLNYFFSKENDGNWYLKIFTETAVGESDSDEFIYKSEEPFADSLCKILHVQYGDNSIVPPQKYHSVRGIGAMIYSASWAMNMFRSDLFQHAKEQMRMYLKIQAPADKARENMVNLQQYGIVEDGVSFVPQSERHQIDTPLVDNVLAQCRQNITDNSSAFVQDIDNGSEKEQTLGEAKIRQMTANNNVSTLLTMMYYQENPFYQETVRRYLAPNSGDTGIEAFQKSCIEDGIPKELMVYDNWKVEADRVLGAGDQSLALQQATAIYGIPDLDPKSKRMASRQLISTISQDPAKGMLYVPDSPDSANSGAMTANDVFGTLMQGVPVALRQGIEQSSYIETMLKSMAAVVQQITQTDNVGTQQQIIGLEMVGQDIQQHIAILESDPTQKQSVKQFGDALGKMMNLVKAFSQRLAEKNKSQQNNLKEFLNIDYKSLNPDTQNSVLQMLGLPPSQMPATNPDLQKTQQKLQQNQLKFEQSLRHKQISFQLKQIQDLTSHAVGLSQEQQSHRQQMLHDAAMNLAQLMQTLDEPQSEPANN